jgi:murein DD-endopeptidase MepM/ murein hydrolase activator NlpD
MRSTLGIKTYRIAGLAVAVVGLSALYMVPQATVAGAAPLLVAAAATAQAKLSFPVKGKFGEGFGPRANPAPGQQNFHKGLDFLAPLGTPVKAAGGGTVTFVGNKKGYGNFITLDNGDGLSTKYAHLSKMDVVVGDTVTAGQVIGAVGNAEGGPQLHFEVLQDNEPVDPVTYLPAGEP